MYARLETPVVADLRRLYTTLGTWQQSPWSGQLHPGDVGWRITAGAERTADDLRVWTRRGDPVAIGLLDGENVLRMAFEPEALDDDNLACGIADDLMNPSSSIVTGDSVIVEARGAHTLTDILRQRGWRDDAPWVPLVNDSKRPDVGSTARDADVHVQQAGRDDVSEWAAVHWSAFKGVPCDAASHERYSARVRNVFDGLFTEQCIPLITRDADGIAVAIACVWFAGEGRPGLVEPMGVHADYQGRGYGKKVTSAAVDHLVSGGASSAVVVAEGKNPGAQAAYKSAGFTPLSTVCDLQWTRSVVP